MNIGVHVSFLVVVFSGICTVVGFLGHMVVLFLFCFSSGGPIWGDPLGASLLPPPLNQLPPVSQILDLHRKRDELDSESLLLAIAKNVQYFLLAEDNTNKNVYFFNWSIVALQCCVSLYCTVDWPHVDTHALPLSLRPPPPAPAPSTGSLQRSLCCSAGSHQLSALHGPAHVAIPASQCMALPLPAPCLCVMSILYDWDSIPTL